MKATQNKIRTGIGCVIYNLASYWLNVVGLIGLLDYEYVTLPRCYVGSTKVSVFCVALNWIEGEKFVDAFLYFYQLAGTNSLCNYGQNISLIVIAVGIVFTFGNIGIAPSHAIFFHVMYTYIVKFIEFLNTFWDEGFNSFPTMWYDEEKPLSVWRLVYFNQYLFL